MSESIETREFHPCPTELTAIMLEYEGRHEVEAYCAHDWHVWPLLRTWMTFDLYGYYYKAIEQNPVAAAIPSSRRDVSRMLERINGHARLFRDCIRARIGDWLNGNPPFVSPRDVVILTDSNRRQQIGAEWWHRIADPLVLGLSEIGLSCSVWEWGDPRRDCYGGAPSINGRYGWEFKVLGRSKRSQHAISPPTWYHEFSEWFGPKSGRRISWIEVLHHINYVTIGSYIFEDWLRRSRARCLIVDCWYAPGSMSATLAARRLGVPVLDFQHGVQSPHHYSYRDWSRSPERGYEVVPDYFWFWGEMDAESFRQSNQFSSEIIVGGNLGMNKVRASTVGESPTHKLRSSNQSEPTIFFNYCPPEDDHDRVLLELLKLAPREWTFMVRLHPVIAARAEEIENKLRHLGHYNAHVREATKMSLYQLIALSDVHVARTSSCALEALAFGVPTVLFHEEGTKFYSEFLASKSMIFEPDSNRLPEAVRRAFCIPLDRCIKHSHRVFASDDYSRQALARIKSLVLEHS